MKNRFAFPLGILLAFVAFGSLATIYNPPAAAVETDPVFLAAKDTDGTLTANSDAKVATQKAVKTYVTAHSGITNSAGATIVPVSNGTNLIASSIVDDGTVLSGGSGWSKFIFDGTLSIIGDAAGNNNNTRIEINDDLQTINLVGAVSSSGNPVDFGTGGTVLYAGGIGSSRAGSFSGVGTATTSFVVTIGVTMANNTYKVNVTPTAALSAAVFYISAKTTTTFTVTYLAGLTGTVTFDWAVFP